MLLITQGYSLVIIIKKGESPSLRKLAFKHATAHAMAIASITLPNPLVTR
jgi:hypothetical protein